MHYRKNIVSFVIALATIMITLCGFAHAELVGIQPGFPSLVYNSQGTLTYDAGTDQLSVNANAIAIRFSSVDPPRFINPGITGSDAVTIRVSIDETGALTGGAAGDDLRVEGAVDQDGDGTIDYDGILLTGEVVQFGSLDSGGPTDSYDFRFEFTGGLLASSFVGMDIGVMLTSESSDFANDFTVNFGGGAKGVMGPIEAVCALDVKVEGCVHVPGESDCEGKVIRMELEYTGQGCDASNNSQEGKRVKCEGDPAGAEPVSIVVTGRKHKKIFRCKKKKNGIWTTETDVNIGETILVDAAIAGKKRLKPTTRIKVIDANGNLLQKIRFDTSCRQPLRVGDQFGSMKIVSLTSTIGGEATEPEDEVCITELPDPATTPGADVEYTYTITNNGVDILSNMTVLDDVVGTVAGSPIGMLLPGETVTLSQTKYLSAETTNTVTVTGTAFGIWQCEAGASETITQAEVQPGPDVCENMIQAMLLKYTGPDIMGATVTIVADKFRCRPVVYTGVDLTSGLVLSSPSENGWTIDATVHTKHGTDGLGAKTKIYINCAGETIHTSCSTPFARQAPAPLNDPKGAPSPNWFVEEFTQK